MNDYLLKSFQELISEQTGLHIRVQDYRNFKKAVAGRVRSLKLRDTESYYRLLSTESPNSFQEWREFTRSLTTGESYFFRDRGQFTILRGSIIPDIIRRNRNSGSIRIWSAGCSTGEEPYSVAVLLKELIPLKEHWNITIIGTDINEESIIKAKEGHYGEWSFRHVDDSVRSSYFIKQGKGWRIDKEIREMVIFKVGNLLKDTFPDAATGMYEMDLILCRNVFIYFDNNTISSVVKKFTETLRKDGVLITGHAELYAKRPEGLLPKMYPESVIYQKTDSLSSSIRKDTNSVNIAPVVGLSNKFQTLSKSKITPNTAGNDNRAVKSLQREGKKDGFTTNKDASAEVIEKNELKAGLVDIEASYSEGKYEEVLSKAEALINKHSDFYAAYLFVAKAGANLGEYEKAATWCNKAIEADYASDKAYYLLAHIAEVQGDVEEAKALFKKVIYLAPSDIAAYIELGALYERENDMTRANKMRSTALELLDHLPPETSIEPYREYTAKELAQYIRNMLTT